MPRTLCPQGPHLLLSHVGCDVGGLNQNHLHSLALQALRSGGQRSSGAGQARRRSRQAGEAPSARHLSARAGNRCRGVPELLHEPSPSLPLQGMRAAPRSSCATSREGPTWKLSRRPRCPAASHAQGWEGQQLGGLRVRRRAAPPAAASWPGGAARWCRDAGHTHPCTPCQGLVHCIPRLAPSHPPVWLPS